MATSEQLAIPGIPVPQQRQNLLMLALSNGAAIDVIERLAALEKESLAREAMIDFNEALSRVQEQIKRIAPDLENPDKKNRYASYAAIDRVIRPIYSPEGFSLSFTHADSPKEDHIRVVCRVALRAHVEFYQIDMPVDTQGPKGNAVMTMTHATAASDSYAKRYLIKDIFNIAIGDDDRDGNGPVNQKWLISQLDEIDRCETQEGLQAAYQQAATIALDEHKDVAAYQKLKIAKNARKKQLAQEASNVVG